MSVLVSTRGCSYPRRVSSCRVPRHADRKRTLLKGEAVLGLSIHSADAKSGCSSLGLVYVA
jgi:hypothetical protein